MRKRSSRKNVELTACGFIAVVVVCIVLLVKGCDVTKVFTPTPASPDDYYDRDPRRDGGY